MIRLDRQRAKALSSRLGILLLALAALLLGAAFPAQAENKGAYLLNALAAALDSHPHVGEVRGKGLMCAVELVQDRRSKAEFPVEEKVGPRVHAAAQQRGIFSRLRGDVFCIAPPIVTTHQQLDQIVEALAQSIQEVLGG